MTIKGSHGAMPGCPIFMLSPALLLEAGSPQRVPPAALAVSPAWVTGVAADRGATPVDRPPAGA